MCVLFWFLLYHYWFLDHNSIIRLAVYPPFLSSAPVLTFTINQQFSSNLLHFDTVIDTICKGFKVYLFNWDISLLNVTWNKMSFSAHCIQYFSGMITLREGKIKHQPFQPKFQALADQCCSDHVRCPKGQSNPFNILIPTNRIDNTFLVHLDVIYFHAYSCAVWILQKKCVYESRLRLLHVWLLFLIEKFHKYIKHCHSHGTSLHIASWFLLWELDHSEVTWSQLHIYLNLMLTERAILCKSVHYYSKIISFSKVVGGLSKFLMRIRILISHFSL